MPTAAALRDASPDALKGRRPPLWHSWWNIAALCAVNVPNVLWWLLPEGSALLPAADVAADAAFVAYQVIEAGIDVAVPGVTSTVTGALTHHVTSAAAVLALAVMQRSQATPEASAALVHIKHQLVACGEWQKLPRMLARVLRRGGWPHRVCQLVSDAMLIGRLLWWPLICPFGARAVVSIPALRAQAAAFAPFYAAHYLVYAVQLRLFRKDVVRLRGSCARAWMGLWN
eukprot:TRINITY_DN13108_c0_g1_i1.p1 TRINITY_DN13108_c0_g1~~TRINITY_DN13108_c0_g1_i1.p1  ORF type:complete len:243 (+),score=55.88 TRINITY_DN13108_c0_g1_i1:45-731(+)